MVDISQHEQPVDLAKLMDNLFGLMSKTSKPKAGAERVKEMFLLFPTTMVVKNGYAKTKWLIFAKYRQIYLRGSWINLYWCDYYNE